MGAIVILLLVHETPSTPLERVPAKLQQRYTSIVSLTDAVCREHLNEEYAAICRKMAAALCRKRPSPLAGSQAASWAGGIAYAVGSVNFLSDETQKPHLSTSALCALFGVSQSTVAAKASQIRKLLGLYPLHPEWCLPSKLEQNPFLWMLQIDGVVIDLRMASRKAQESALELGLIPYLPGTSGDSAPIDQKDSR